MDQHAYFKARTLSSAPRRSSIKRDQDVKRGEKIPTTRQGSKRQQQKNKNKKKDKKNNNILPAFAGAPKNV